MELNIQFFVNLNAKNLVRIGKIKFGKNGGIFKCEAEA